MVRETRISNDLPRDQIPDAIEDDLTSGIRKQISILLPLSQWKAVRQEAARQKIPMTRLVESWITPHIKKLART